MTWWLDGVVTDTQEEVIRALEQLVQEKGIKAKVLEDAQELVKTAARHILDETQPELQPFPSVPIDGDKELQYLLVLEFLQSAGFKFAPSVLKFESQHPEIQLDRRALGKRLNLCTYDRTPYLVQLIEEQMKDSEV
jgi:beta-phosphoglucomutase-like phosphatase (HAD superfamily)